MAVQLGLVAVLVPDYDAGIRFFVGGLGLTLLEDSDHGGCKRWVRVGQPDAQTAFLLARAVGPQADYIGEQGGGRVWLFLYSDDFATDAARITEAGGVFEETPRDEAYGRVAVFRDPFGNRWDLIQPR